MDNIESHLLEEFEESKSVRSTWDIPFNPSKTVSISDAEIVKKLSNYYWTDVDECSHKRQDFKCLCGSLIRGTKCKECGRIFCDMKTCSVVSRKAETDWNGTASYNNEAEDIPRDLKVEEEKTEDVIKMEKNSGSGGAAVKQRVNPFRVSSNLPTNALLEAKNPPVGMGRGRGRGRGFINPVDAPGSRPSVGPGSSSVVESQSRQAELQQPELEKRQSGLKHEGMESFVEPEISQQEGRSEDKCNIVARKAAEQLIDTNDVEDNQLEETSVDILAVCKLFGKQEDLRSHETKTFVISEFYSPQQLFIVPCVTLDDDFDNLLDEINDFCLDAASLSEDPIPGSCVCAPKEDEIMHRAVVLRKVRNSDFVVRFLDTGEESKVSLSDLKPLPEHLYKEPLIGFIVKLKGIPDELPLLSLREFHTNFVPRAIKKKWKLSEVSQLQDGTWEVKLDTKAADLAESILKLQVWQWESHFKSGCHNDTEISEAQEWPYTEVLQFKPSDFPPEPIPMELVAIDDEKSVLAFKNLKHRSMKAEADVLRRQLDRYIHHVKATPHYPKINENFLFLPDSKLPDRRSWRRAIRVDQSQVYCHDTHEFFPLDGLGETRRLCPDFFKVPAQVVFASIQGDKSAAREFLKTLKIGKFYQVSIEGFNEEDNMLVASIES